MQDRGNVIAMPWRKFLVAGIAATALIGSSLVAQAEDAETTDASKAPCTDDAMIVFDASGSVLIGPRRYVQPRAWLCPVEADFE